MIIKRCFQCNKWFKSKLLSYQPYCPRCKKIYWPGLIERIKRKRFIEARNLDVYDTDYYLEKYKRYERVCRVCGARLLNKDGKHSNYKRYCSEHSFEDFNTNWGFSRSNFVWNFQEKRRTSIILTAMDKGIDKILSRYYDGELGRLLYYICQDCHEPLLFGDIEVHHIIPVHSLTEKNLHLIWDESNFKCICHKCHNKIDHGYKKKRKRAKEKKHFFWRDRKYRSKIIDEFFMKEMKIKNGK